MMMIGSVGLVAAAAVNHNDLERHGRPGLADVGVEHKRQVVVVRVERYDDAAIDGDHSNILRRASCHNPSGKVAYRRWRDCAGAARCEDLLEESIAPDFRHWSERVRPITGPPRVLKKPREHRVYFALGVRRRLEYGVPRVQAIVVLCGRHEHRLGQQARTQAKIPIVVVAEIPETTESVEKLSRKKKRAG